MLKFAYGSNLNTAYIQGVVPSAKPLGRAEVLNYKVGFPYLSRNYQGGLSGLVSAPGERMWGVLYTVDDAEVPYGTSTLIDYQPATGDTVNFGSTPVMRQVAEATFGLNLSGTGGGVRADAGTSAAIPSDWISNATRSSEPRRVPSAA